MRGKKLSKKSLKSAFSKFCEIQEYSIETSNCRFFFIFQSPRNMYVIKIPKGFDFEERVREVEDELGMSLKDRVPIKYNYPKYVTAFRHFCVWKLKWTRL